MNDLLIVGAYVGSKESEEILHESMTRLCPYFDIALVTHSPISERIQKLVKYFIYDHRNEIMQDKVTTVYWGSYPTFDYEIHPNGIRRYYSFAIYRSLTNAIKMLSDEYDSFIYLEGDAYFSPEDAVKLRDMKQVAKDNNKEGMFISFGSDFLCSTYFFCSMAMFKKAFPFFKNSNDYMAHCNKIGSHGQLENFLYRGLSHTNSLAQVHIIDGTKGLNYFPTSQIGISFTTGKDNNSSITYTSEVLRSSDSNDLVFMYIVHQNIPNSEPSRKMYIDGEFIMELPTTMFCTAFKINPKNDKFLLEIGRNKFYYDKSEILAESNKSFIKLK